LLANEVEERGVAVAVGAEARADLEERAGSHEELVVLPLDGDGANRRGVAINLSWLRGVFRCQRRGEPLSDWLRRHPLAGRVSPPNVDSWRIWPVIDLDSDARGALDGIRSGVGEGARPCGVELSLTDLRSSLSFPNGVESGLMRYPEIVALIDGVPFRYPEPYFINQMRALRNGAFVRRDPDWYRSFPGLPQQWRGVSCPLCGGNTSFRAIHVIGPSRIVRCPGCELEFDQPQAIVGHDALDKYASSVRDETGGSVKSLVRAELSASLLVEGLSELAPSLLGAPLLDVGCASGELLHVLAERHGWDRGALMGVDPSALSARTARERYGQRVFEGEVEEVPCEDCSFAVIVLFNTVEHLARPRPALAVVRRLLRHGGILLAATVPNSGCLASRAFPEGFMAKNFPDGQHHVHFTPQTLGKLFQAEGFDVARTDGERREPEPSRVREIATWLAHGCGVDLATCEDESRMLAALETRLRRLRERQPPHEGRFEIHDSDFGDSESVVAFWQREIWSSPLLSDVFDLWARPRQP